MFNNDHLFGGIRQFLQTMGQEGRRERCHELHCTSTVHVYDEPHAVAHTKTDTYTNCDSRPITSNMIRNHINKTAFSV